MREESGHYIAESPADFSGWEILFIEDFKPGVKRVHIRSSNNPPASFRIVYCAEEHLPTDFRQVCV